METVLRSQVRHQPKTNEVCDQLESLALRLGPGAKLPTVNQLIVDLQTSRGTLAKALDELESQNILQRVHGNGIFVSPQVQQNTIAILYAVGNTGGSPFWDLLIDYLRKRAADGNEQSQIYIALSGENGTRLPPDFMQAGKNGKISGVICLGYVCDEGYQWLAENKIPVVTFASPTGTHLITVHRSVVPQLGAEELIHQGCQRIGLWMPFGLWERPHEENEHPGVLDQFQETLAENGVSFMPQWSWRVHEREDYIIREPFQEQGYRAAMEMYEGKDLNQCPDGIIITNDVMARGVFAGLNELGVHLGKDIKVVSHATRGSTMLLGYERMITRIEVDPEEIVREAFQILGRLMTDGASPPTTYAIEPAIRRPLRRAVRKVLQ